MNKSTPDLRLLALALCVGVLGACSAPDADPAAMPAPAATSAADESGSMPGATPPEAGETAEASAAAPMGPVDPMRKQLVQMAAGLFAAERACMPERAASVSEARAANRKAMAGMMGTPMSEAQMDALFDAAYADAQRKMEAMSSSDRTQACAELQAAAEAGAAAVGG